jgi:hypothetical protein
VFLHVEDALWLASRSCFNDSLAVVGSDEMDIASIGDDSQKRVRSMSERS